MTRPPKLFDEETLDDETRESMSGQSAVVCLAVPGAPVVYISDEFEAHTGYSKEEAVGRNLSFLQGPETESDAVELFRHLMRTGTSGTIRITNYRKDKSLFIHECDLRPVRDSDGRISHFVAIQRPVSGGERPA